MRITSSVVTLLLTLVAPACWAQSTLVITSDAPCTLNVNGKAIGPLVADEPKAVDVKPGQQLVLCRDANNVRVEARPQCRGGAAGSGRSATQGVKRRRSSPAYRPVTAPPATAPWWTARPVWCGRSRTTAAKSTGTARSAIAAACRRPAAVGGCRR